MSKSKSSPNEYLAQFDRLPAEEMKLQRIRKFLDTLAEFYGFERMFTSSVENYRAFAPLVKAGLMGEYSPLVCKTKGGLEVFLRPSGALSILRAYGPQKMNDLPHPLRFSFEGERFSLDTNPKGARVRSRREWGLLMIGEEGPIAEAEMVQVIWKALEDFGVDLKQVSLRVNALGCSECRSSFRSAFVSYFRARSGRLCKNCNKSLKKNPLKILSCEEEKCKAASLHAPQVLDFLCETCKKHLRGFLEFLDEVSITYSLDPKIFRDSSWVGVLLFEFVVRPKASPENPGTEELSSVGFAEGGRMSQAGGLIAGKHLDVAGVSFFFDSFATAFLKDEATKASDRPRVFLTQLGELAKRKSLGIIEVLRHGGIEVRESLGRDSIKSQLKVAENRGAEVALILGQKEALDKSIIVREVQSGIQETVSQEKLIEFLKKKLKK